MHQDVFISLTTHYSFRDVHRGLITLPVIGAAQGTDGINYSFRDVAWRLSYPPAFCSTSSTSSSTTCSAARSGPSSATPPTRTTFNASCKLPRLRQRPRGCVSSGGVTTEAPAFGVSHETLISFSPYRPTGWCCLSTDLAAVGSLTNPPCTRDHGGVVEPQPASHPALGCLGHPSRVIITTLDCTAPIAH